MISFIIIGRNEGWKLSKCIESVFDMIKANNLKAFEIIYVDSDSNDDSIVRAKRFEEIRIIKIAGQINAAVARNVGANHAKGDVFFFIDGDMEIIPSFLPLIYDEESGLQQDFISGQFIDYEYDYSGKLIKKHSLRNKNKSDKKEFTVGGLFLLSAKVWYSVGGMKNKYRRSQDIDLAIRLAGNGISLLRKKELLAIHHTIPYNDLRRSWQMLLNGSELYRAVLLRDNFSIKYQWILFFRENYSSIFLFLNLIILLIVALPIYMLIPYFLLIFARAFKPNSKSTYLKSANKFLYFLARDISTWYALFFFWPSSKKVFAIHNI
jgi:glycosyltransferase involved in cell wall biosynthesis